MKILVIGGTRFLGKALVEAALERGHTLSLFHRGRTNPDWFPELEKLHGDRNNDLGALSNHQWDAVIDTCAYFPRQVSTLLESLHGAIGHYTLISSISVYADFSQVGLDEDSPVSTISDPTIEEITGETYGALKALCEQVAQQALPGRNLVIRPGLIVGPFDPTDRFTYWPVRVARAGRVLVPDSPHWHTQVIDVRDQAEWTIQLVEAGQTGIFNATGPLLPLTFGELLETCCRVSQSAAEFVWVDTDFLLSHQVVPWSEIPLWAPGEENAGFDRVSIAKALRHGLTFRPLEDTLRATLEWHATRPADMTLQAGLSPQKETELLAAWQQHLQA